MRDAEIVPRESWPDQSPTGRRDQFWNDVADAVRAGNVVLVHGVARQSVDRSMRSRGIAFETRKHPDGFLVRLKP